jgi:hypothetical protein
MFYDTGYTAPCKMACWLLILKLFLYLICIKFHYCILVTLPIKISHNLYTYILYAAVFFFLYYYKNDFPYLVKDLQKINE